MFELILMWQTTLPIESQFQLLDLRSLTSVALAGFGYFVFQKGLLNSWRQRMLGVALLLAAAVLSVAGVTTDLKSALLLIIGAIAIGGGLALVTMREPVHAALGFATTILSICGLCFLQSAGFLGAAAIMVYAGAIIIVFMFVLMFAQSSRLTTADLKLTAPALAALAGAALLVLILSALFTPGAFPPPIHNSVGSPSGGLGDLNRDQVAELGRAMYTDYLWSVEIAGTLLLVATVGAIAIAQNRFGERA